MADFNIQRFGLLPEDEGSMPGEQKA